MTHKLPSKTSFPVKAARVLGLVLLPLRVAQVCNLWHTQNLKFGLRGSGGVMVPKEAEYIPNLCCTLKMGCTSEIFPDTGMGWEGAHCPEPPIHLFSHDFIPSPSKPLMYFTSSASHGSSSPNSSSILKARLFQCFPQFGVV